MPLKIKITPIKVDLVVNKALSPKVRQEMIATYARGRIAEADAKNARILGASPPKTVTVDGMEGAPLESVNPDQGRIIAEWTLSQEAVQWIMRTLRERSPVQSGRYRDSHTLFADGQEADADNPPPAQEYTILNPVPYSRKIEIGKTESGRDFVVQVENRIYERTAQAAAARFGNIAKIRFTYQSSVGGKSAADRVPAIVVTLRG